MSFIMQHFGDFKNSLNDNKIVNKIGNNIPCIDSLCVKHQSFSTANKQPERRKLKTRKTIKRTVNYTELMNEVYVFSSMTTTCLAVEIVDQNHLNI